MPIQTLTFGQLQQLAATTFSANAALPANTDAGSTLGSIFNAESLLALNVQYQLIYAAAIARLSTTTVYADAVTFCAAFGVSPIGASPSGGLVTLSTPSPVGTPFPIPAGTVQNPGTQLQTDDGLIFTVIADASNEFYDPTSNTYIIPTGQSSANVTVVCNTAGSIGNVAVDQISQVFGTLPGIQTIANAAAYDNGIDQESLPALKARFTLQMSTGVVGTANAILAAVAKIQAGLTLSMGDLKHPDGTEWDGGFTVVVNELGQNSGPGSPLLSAASAAILATKAAGASFSCIGPALVPVNGAATVVLQNPLPSGLVAGTVVANVTAAFVAFLNNIGLNQQGGSTICPLSLVYAVLQAVPGVAYIDGLTLNSATADVTAPFADQIVAGTTSFHT